MLYFYICMTSINPVLLAQGGDGALNHLKPVMLQADTTLWPFDRRKGFYQTDSRRPGRTGKYTSVVYYYQQEDFLSRLME